MHKAKETRSCGCNACKRGAATPYGKFIHQQIHRRIRRQTKQMLSHLLEIDAFMPVKGGTPFTD